MATDSKLFTIRWAGSTLGFRLSGDEAILYNDERTALIIGSNGHPTKIIATYDFSPDLTPTSLQLEFRSINTVILGDFSESNSGRFLDLPGWLSTLFEVKSLALSNAKLTNIAFCQDFPLEYLDCRNVYYNNWDTVLKPIESFKNLKIFVHDESFPNDHLSLIREKLPNIRFASKESGKSKP